MDRRLSSEPGATVLPATGIVVDALREQIISGLIEPGEKIVITDLKAQYDVSHIPIRGALRQLEAEKLAVNVARRGSFASELSLGELAGLYDLRRLIDAEVAVRAAARFDGSGFDRIEVALRAVNGHSATPTSAISSSWIRPSIGQFCSPGHRQSSNRRSVIFGRCPRGTAASAFANSVGRRRRLSSTGQYSTRCEMATLPPFGPQLRFISR